MTKTKILLLVVTIMALIGAIGATVAFAQDGEETPESAPAETPEGAETDESQGTDEDQGDEDQSIPNPFFGGPFGGHGHHGHHGFAGPMAAITSKDELLAEALGIEVDALQVAEAAAKTVYMEQLLTQAVEDGLITQEQADEILENGFFGHGFGLPGLGHGDLLDSEDSIDYDALLAEELGISVDELEAARDAAYAAQLAEMIEAGLITEEQAELMQAMKALKETIDHESLTAAALGMSVDEFQAAREEGQSLSDLIEAAELTVVEFQEALQAGYEAAVQDAVDSGVITQEQADEILSSSTGLGFGMHGFFGPKGFGGFGCQDGLGGPGSFFGQPSDSSSTTDDITGTSI